MPGAEVLLPGAAMSAGLAAGKLASYAIQQKREDMKTYREGVEAAYSSAGVEQKIPKVLTLNRALGLVGAAAAQVYSNQQKLGVPKEQGYRDATAVVNSFEETARVGIDRDTIDFIVGKSIKAQERKGDESGYGTIRKIGAALSRTFGSLGDRLTGEKYREAVKSAYKEVGQQPPTLPRVFTEKTAIGLAFKAGTEGYKTAIERGEGFDKAREQAVSAVRAFGAETGVQIPKDEIRDTFKEVEARIEKKFR